MPKHSRSSRAAAQEIQDEYKRRLETRMLNFVNRTVNGINDPSSKMTVLESDVLPKELMKNLHPIAYNLYKNARKPRNPGDVVLKQPDQSKIFGGSLAVNQSIQSEGLSSSARAQFANIANINDIITNFTNRNNFPNRRGGNGGNGGNRRGGGGGDAPHGDGGNGGDGGDGGMGGGNNGVDDVVNIDDDENDNGLGVLPQDGRGPAPGGALEQMGARLGQDPQVLRREGGDLALRVANNRMVGGDDADLINLVRGFGRGTIASRNLSNLGMMGISDDLLGQDVNSRSVRRRLVMDEQDDPYLKEEELDEDESDERVVALTDDTDLRSFILDFFFKTEVGRNIQRNENIVITTDGSVLIDGDNYLNANIFKFEARQNNTKLQNFIGEFAHSGPYAVFDQQLSNKKFMLDDPLSAYLLARANNYAAMTNRPLMPLKTGGRFTDSATFDMIYKESVTEALISVYASLKELRTNTIPSSADVTGSTQEYYDNIRILNKLELLAEQETHTLLVKFITYLYKFSGIKDVVFSKLNIPKKVYQNNELSNMLKEQILNQGYHGHHSPDFNQKLPKHVRNVIEEARRLYDLHLEAINVDIRRNILPITIIEFFYVYTYIYLTVNKFSKGQQPNLTVNLIYKYVRALLQLFTVGIKHIYTTNVRTCTDVITDLLEEQAKNPAIVDSVYSPKRKNLRTQLENIISDNAEGDEKAAIDKKETETRVEARQKRSEDLLEKVLTADRRLLEQPLFEDNEN